MNLNFRAMAALCSVAVSLSSGCESVGTDSSSGGVSPLFSSGNSGSNITEPYAPTETDFVPSDTAGCTIRLSENGVGIDGVGAQAQGDSVLISSGGVYRLTGSGEQRIVLDCNEDVSLILQDARLASPIESNCPLLTVTLADDTNNSVIVSDDETGITSHGDILINGNGYLSVNAGSGIRADGDVKLCGGKIELITDGDGICGGNIISADTSLEMICSGNGLNAENGYVSISGDIIDITSAENGILATDAVFISGGETDISCGGGSSAVVFIEADDRYPYGRHGGFFTDGTQEFDFSKLTSADKISPVSKKGISSGGYLRINGGRISIDSADDSISAHGDILIDGGDTVLSSGDDAVHAYGNLTINSGSVSVGKCYTGIECLSLDINGGTAHIRSTRDGVKTAGGNDMDFIGSDNDRSHHYVSISGGELTIEADGDGIDAGGTAAISGGAVLIFSATDDDFGSLDYSDSFALSGGTFAAFGSDEATKAPSIVSGICISLDVQLSAGSTVEITDGGNVLFTATLPTEAHSLIFSSEELAKGTKYHVTANGEEIYSLTATQGICGNGPRGRGGNTADMPDGTGTASGIVA